MPLVLAFLTLSSTNTHFNKIKCINIQIYVRYDIYRSVTKDYCIYLNRMNHVVLFALLIKKLIDLDVNLIKCDWIMIIII